jgi:hypothetical protein
MKLSEAIRLGAMLKPQAFDALFTGGATCAVGAALDAIGVELLDEAVCKNFPPDSLWDEAELRFPLLAVVAVHPVDLRHMEVGMLITDLNDFHLWSREQIADWVESVEPKAPQGAVAVVAADPCPAGEMATRDA